jgi:hypothetical protein
MRASILAGLLLAASVLPAAAEVRPIQGAYNVTASAAKGVVYGTGYVVKGAAKGTVAVAHGVGRGAACIVTLGSRC